MKTGFFGNVAKISVTYSKSKGKVSNDKKIQDCLMKIILQTSSPETSSYVSQTEGSSEKI